MNAFEVTGGKRLKGEITPQGAKNEALQVISAVLLTKGKITISNIPDILDVNLLIEVLEEMGVKTRRSSRHECSFQADDVNVDYLNSEAYRKKSGKLRGSIMLAGPLLARFKKLLFPNPEEIRSAEEDWIPISSVLKSSAPVSHMTPVTTISGWKRRC